jgi:hypothetical protein
MVGVATTVFIGFDVMQIMNEAMSVPVERFNSH